MAAYCNDCNKQFKVMINLDGPFVSAEEIDLDIPYCPFCGIDLDIFVEEEDVDL